ncbi:MAG TPA: hypothetical protein VL947_01565 [Cytophagales bacterium]|nr:hypothetical protein [Cytophagales bacterium]
MAIPKQYLPIMPYLILDEASSFLEFAKATFGAEEQLVVPAQDGSIMHGEIRIGEAVVMFAQSGETWKEKTAAMFLYVDSVELVYKAALLQGAVSLEEPQQKDYGYAAGIMDPFGNQWFVVQQEQL